MFVSVNPRFFLLTVPKHRWIETPWCFHIRLCGSACLIYLDNEFPIQIVADCCMLFEFGSFLVMIPLIIYVYTVVVYSILCIYIYIYIFESNKSCTSRIRCAMEVQGHSQLSTPQT